MKKYLFFLIMSIIISSCSNDDSDSNQLFRNKFNNTSWVDSYGDVYTFKTGKLFYYKVTDTDLSYFYQVGTYNNIDYDGCVYDTVNNVIDSEDNDTFAIRQITSTGVGSFCPASSVIITFEVINENSIEVQTNYDGFTDSYIINKTNNVSTQNAVDGTSIGWLW
jgi:hypothetical protein